MMLQMMIMQNLIAENAELNSILDTPEVAHAVDYGIVGEVFPIKERNLVEVIQEKLLKLHADGKLETYNQQIQAKVKSQIERPAPVAGITHTKTPRTFTYDPSITVAADLKDTHGTEIDGS